MNSIKRGISIGVTVYVAVFTFSILGGVDRGIGKAVNNYIKAQKGQNDAEKKEESAEESEDR